MGDEREVTGIQKQSSPVGEWSTVIMTGEEFTNGSIPDRDGGKEDQGSVNLVAQCWEVFSCYIVVKVVRKTKWYLMYPNQKRLRCCNLRTPYQKWIVEISTLFMNHCLYIVKKIDRLNDWDGIGWEASCLASSHALKVKASNYQFQGLPKEKEGWIQCSS